MKYINGSQEIINHIKDNGYDFSGIYFRCSVDFQSILKMSSKTIRETVNFQNAKIHGSVNFSGIIFHNQVNFKGCNFNKFINFKGCKFLQTANFENIRFNGNVNERDGLIDFSRCEFSFPTDFSNVKFSQFTKFNGTKFTKFASFENCVFNGTLNFANVSFMKGANFHWANFLDSSNFSDLNVPDGELNFDGAHFQKNSYFFSSKIKHLELSKTIIGNGLFFLKSEIKKCNRETARVIKNEFKKQNNEIEAFQYANKEMRALHVESIFGLFKRKEFWKSWFNLGSSTLNFVSNLHRKSWIVGIIFTLSSSIGLYYCYVNYLTYVPCTFSFWETFPEFLIPTHKFNFIEGSKVGICSGIFDILGRISTSYGIYQTIQAFRKYGRN